LDDARKEAQGGNSEAQWYLGHCYSTGQRVEKDLTAAASWFHKAADRGNKFGQFGIAVCYYNGQGVEKNDDEALKWFILAGENGHADAAYLAGSLTEQKGDIETARYYYLKALENGHPKAQGAFQGAASDASSKWSEDFVKTKAQSGDVDAQWDLAYHYYKANSLDAAVFWFRKAAENGHSYAQYYLGTCYYAGRGLEKNIDEAIKWYALAANNGEPNAAFSMGALAERVGDIELAKSWYNLAVRNGHPTAAARLQTITTRTVEKEKPPNDVKPHRQPTPENSRSAGEIAQTRPVAFGTGFFITEDGYLVTNEHVVGNTTRVELFTAVGTVSAKVVKVDVANDLALLKAEGRFALLPIVASRAMRLGGTVATVGFPNIGLQGISPKLTKGEITSLAGAKDDPRYFQISVPVQPGNSGGALVDEHGNVVGVVAAKLDARAALDASGALPENVNYAVKSSLLLNFLESLPEVTAKLKEPETKERKFEDVVESTKQTAVLLVVY
jgi:TPR repeat protein